jgi:hypothetical protein
MQNRQVTLSYLKVVFSYYYYYLCVEKLRSGHGPASANVQKYTRLAAKASPCTSALQPSRQLLTRVSIATVT